MPLLAGIGGFIVVVMKALLAYRIASIVIKVATRVLLLSVIIAAFVLILSSIQTAMDSLNAVAPPMLATCYSWFIPSNFAVCLSVIVSVQLIIWAWHWQKYAFDFLAGGVT